MLKRIVSLLAALVLALTLGLSGAHASARIQAKIGERVDLMGASANPGASYKWVVKKGDSILNTQVLRNFNYTFAEQGQYAINLTATDGSKVEATTVEVLIGDVFVPSVGVTSSEGSSVLSGPQPLRINLNTLPALNSQKQAVLLGDSGRVTFFLSQSTGDIIEYRIDRNVYADSDGNGIANDDIDNDTSASYLTGQPWTTEYKLNESAKIAAEITLVDKKGDKAKSQVEIVFEPLDQSGALLAVLDSTPPTGSDNTVHLTGDPASVAFYSRRSKGKILEYRLDKDIFTDSNNDGDPANDIDNLNDPSFRTGDVWEVSYAKTDKQVIAQLIVVGEGGKGSRVQRGIVFTQTPASFVTGTDASGGIQLSADKDFVMKGDPITFTVEGLQLDKDQYIFDWDFQGRGQVDQQVEGSNAVQTIYDTPGIFTVKVKISDLQGRTLERTLELVVKDTLSTKADFSTAIDGNTVTFKDLSTVAMNLTDKRILYQWSFGDTDPANFESQKAKVGESNPVYVYSKKGNYIVTLTITDADQVTDSKSAEITIDQDAPSIQPSEISGGTEAEKPATPAEDGSLLMKILKALLYLILIVVALVILIVGGFLAILKAKHPELTFDELVDEAKHSVFSKIGIHDYEDHPDTSNELPKMPTSGPVHHEDETPTPSVSAAEEAPPQPSWAKGKDIIEGEVEEEKIEDSDKTPPPPVGEQGPTPDWLKNVK